MESFEIYDNFKKLAEQAFSIVTYHGTNAEFCKSIAEKGLLPVKGSFHHLGKQVYLTNEINTAARYAIGNFVKRPIILEIRLSSYKRIKKIKQDPEDLDSEAYDLDVDQSQFWEDDLRKLRDKIRKILEIDGIHLPHELQFLFDYNLDKIKGRNIYKIILNVARSYYNSSTNIQDLKKRIYQYLPPNSETEFFVIANDGTIKLNKNVYDNFHQQMYPKRVPSIAIKAIWAPELRVKEKYYTQAIDNKDLGIRILPFEVNRLNNAIKKAQSWIIHYKDVENNLEHIIDMLETHDQFNFFVKNGILNDLREFSNNNQIEEAYDYIEMLEFVQPGDFAGGEIWLKFDTQTIPLNQVEKIYI